ncbi:MAG: hypothetical protein H6736_10775 [Alphaproteobacteria bacterium]|nr:hypothetical protein [Alphaproteobacteria bacterium]MCB9692286.1 hypothetical protein [Alphaproteobacteria bacterium]
MLVFALLACSDPSGSDYAPAIENDVSSTARVLEDVAVQPSTISECVAGPGDCSLCYEATGTPLSGTLTVGMETTPCGTTWEGERGSVTWTATSSSFAGDWTGGASGVEVALAGAQTNGWSGARVDGDTTLTLDDASLAVDLSGAVTAFALSGSYTGLGGRTYALEVEEVDGELTGAATAPAGASCTVSGTREAPVVDCSR